MNSSNPPSVSRVELNLVKHCTLLGKSNVTLSKIQEINKLSPNVLTFAVGYGSDVINNNKARTSFQRIALKGGTEKPPNQQGVFYAETSADLKKVTDTIVQNIISNFICKK